MKSSTWGLGTKDFGLKKTKISKRYVKMMEFHEECGRAAKEGGSAWI
jgi:hypothetical protein